MRTPRGFIALTSAVIIAATLLVVVVAGSIAGFYERAVLLDSELKERSAAAAQACAQKAFLYLESAGYTGGAYKLNSLDECRVGELVVAGGQVTFKVQATSSRSAVTDLRVVYEPASFKIDVWKEIPTY